MDHKSLVGEAADHIDALEAKLETATEAAATYRKAMMELTVMLNESAAKVDALEDRISDLTSEEHSIPELRQELIDQLEEKRKCYFAVSQYQKANDNLIKERDALTKDAERYRAIRDGLDVDPNHIGAAEIVVSLVDAFGGETLRGDAADEAIDAAIAEGEV
jgi:chromosome segregation ATPase